MLSTLVNKYNVSGPRYTSYPTVPYWNSNSFSSDSWEKVLRNSLKAEKSSGGLSLYIHLPFCESLCTFCGCNKRITKQHSVEPKYINAVLKEWSLYVKNFDEAPVIKEIHLGGGTPTFFSPGHLTYLIRGVLKDAILSEDYEFSFEGHPNSTTKEHLEALYDLGFRRVSFGVQDYNETVQKAIHRVQPFEHVKYVTELAREIGYTSVGHDIIFGLPFQTLEHVEETIMKTNALMPDRLAFYSYAHVPWIKGNGQRGFKDEDLPSAEIKREQYQLGKKLLMEIGYHEIGMDHFALASDSLYKSMISGGLHRNFMGYTTSKTQTMIGLGVSSISDSWYGFAQNEKNLEDYYNSVASNKIPVYRGHFLSDEDLIIRRHILNLMCQFQTNWSDDELYFKELPSVLRRLDEMLSDGLVEIYPDGMSVTSKGKPFVRNVCMAFDLLLQRKQPDTKLFSMTI
ncbi:oxygen-independent coproporphyrinogen III oxidase [Aestuariibaculum sediminum]|uniref:Coproporphyrinogen-III oxidase n=1 Tax=Aestuariibaculum sediminum TaxID=2770637 RepID=A0A8J6U7Q5_9FLAO|nr:oxygen-independent coproporphyrinogen III oxidase [Aestuariibaculum sediminum]MBD0832350.1 oxygen-independent coproporphyrinogen III oxidase [Aestuariibaculum sediminum]